MSGRRPRGRFERFLFSFMGPAQLGSASEPARTGPPPVVLCETCGRPYDEHEVVRSASLTYTRCPEPSDRSEDVT